MKIDAMSCVFPETLWAGTDHSLAVARMAHARLMSAGPWENNPEADDAEDPCSVDPSLQVEDPDAEPPWNYEVQGNVGVITIRGPLVNNDCDWNEYLGVTSYNDIREAAVYGANDNVDALLMCIDSGGGAVSGCSDTARMIRMISEKVKPVYAFSDGTMASAAYWIGSAAKQVYNSDTAILGSVGVITSHMEYSKMYKDMGIGAEVLRAGEFKALANSLEPLTPKARDQIKEQLDGAYGVFISTVAEHRNVTLAVADQQMGQGREFFGIKAVTSGLSDGVSSFDAVISKIQASLDSGAQSSSNSFNSNLDTSPMKRALTVTQIAALAAGATITAEKPPVVEEVKAPVTTAVVVDPPLTAAVAVVEPPQDNAVLAFVQGQLGAAQTEVVNLRVALESEKAKTASLQSAQAGLMAIAAASIRNMRIALNMPNTEYAGLGAEAVVAEHASMNAAFTKAFQAGGVAAPSDTQTEASPVADANRLARVAATMGAKAK